MSVVVARSRAQLEPYIAEWEELSAAAVVPNVFYEPWMLLPAIDHFGAKDDLQVVMVFGDVGPAASRRRVMCALFPLCSVSGFKGLPITRLTTWRHRYCFLCTPLIREGLAPECLDAMLDWVASQQPRTGVLELQLGDGEGRFDQAVTDSLDRRQLIPHATERFTRAALRRTSPTASLYIQATLDAKKRKDLTRLRNRLGERGHLEATSLSDPAAAAVWIDEFLDLEARGWKGRQRTAFAARETDATYFRQISLEAAARDRLMLLALRLDGRAIAMKCNYLAADGAYTFKIAYDEDYRSYSPGVLLELENIREFYDRRLRWMDSCAEADHFMANMLWSERRTIQTIMIPAGGTAARVVVAALPLLRLASRALGRRAEPKKDKDMAEKSGGEAR